MPTTTIAPVEPVLNRFRQAMAELYGPALDRVVLFGSRARGDARADSDYDVAVFLKDSDDLWRDWQRLSAIQLRFLEEGGPFFDAIPFRAASYDDRTPIMHEIRRYGRTL